MDSHSLFNLGHTIRVFLAIKLTVLGAILPIRPWRTWRIPTLVKYVSLRPSDTAPAILDGTFEVLIKCSKRDTLPQVCLLYNRLPEVEIRNGRTYDRQQAYSLGIP